MKTIQLLILSAFLACTVRAATATPLTPTMFVTIDGIVGESTAEGHTGAIEAVSFRAGLSLKGLSLAGGGASKAEFIPIEFFKYLDSTSPKIFLACATVQRIPKATLVVTSEDFTPALEVFRIELTDVLISSLNADSGTTDGNGNLVETVKLSYSTIAWIFTPREADGTAKAQIKGGFDVKKNKVLVLLP